MPILNVFDNLFHNATLLLALTFGYTLVIPRLSQHIRGKAIFQGVLFGVFGVLNMLSPFQLVAGVFFDVRTVITALAAAQGGFTSGALTAVIVSLYRVILGGDGVLAGVMAVWLSVAVGTLCRVMLKRTSADSGRHILVYLGLGFGCAFASLATIVLLPVEARPLFVQLVFIPMLLIFPLTSLTAGFLVFQQHRYFEMVRSLAHERNLLRTLIDNVPDYIFIKDRELRFVVSNFAHTKAAHAVSHAALIGKTAQEYFPPDLARQYEEDDRRVLAGESIIGQERQSVDEAGIPIFVSTTKVPVRDVKGSIAGIIGISRDITAERIRAQQTRQLETELLRTEILKSFIQNASHDFRTPLSIISTNAYLVRRQAEAAPRNERLDIIEKQVDHITKLLDDMMKMVELDAGNRHFQFHPLDVTRVLRNVVTRCQSLAEQHGHTIQMEVEQKVMQIEGDEYLLTLAVNHLVANALSYTPQGGQVTLNAHQDDAYVVVTVQDTGIGISPEDQPRVFEPLYRGDKARPAATGGTGLGLTITKKIIEGHHGSIHFESEPGRGTTFFLCLPVKQQHELELVTVN